MNDKIESFLRSGEGQKLLKQEDQIKNIAESPDGQKIRERMSANGELNRALSTGDTESMIRTMRDILSSEEGTRLTAQLRGIMGK